tara:strand:+ start:233348 stop:234247 length:900 start_codon:yes stop_codon:yes gene_type:complete
MSHFTVAGANPSNNYKPNPKHNGDAFVNHLNKNGIRIFAVIDGAKAPYHYKINGMPNDCYGSNLVAKLLVESFQNVDKIQKWKSGFKHLISMFKFEMNLIQNSFPEFAGEDYRLFNPANAFAIALIDENNGDCVVLQGTDCYMSIRKNGKVETLSVYDEYALQATGRLVEGKMLSDLVNEGMSLEDAQEYEHERVRENRKRVYNKCVDGRNLGGMATLNGDPDLLKCVQIDTFNMFKEGVDAFVAMSDGYCQKMNNDQVACATGALNDGVGAFFDNHVRPLWGKQVRGDVTGAVLKYEK